MSKPRMDQVAHHFNTEAEIFDARTVKIVPHYREMLKGTLLIAPSRSGSTSSCFASIFSL